MNCRIFLYFHCICLCLFLNGCKVKNSDLELFGIFDEEKSFRLVQDVKILPLDSLSNGDEKIRGYIDADKYFFFNSKNTSIYTYHLIDSLWQIEHITKIPLDLANNFRKVSDIFYYTADSIFIYDDSNEKTNHPDLFIININGEIVNSFNVTDTSEGDPIIVNRLFSWFVPSLYFQKGKVYMAVVPSYASPKENWKPLLVYDLTSGEKSLKGSFPVDPSSNAYHNYTSFFHMAFVPDRDEFYFSWAFDANLYRYGINEDLWEKLIMESKYFRKPDRFNNGSDYVLYDESNAWFRGIFYEPKTGKVHRQLLIPRTTDPIFNTLDSKVDGLSISAYDKRVIQFSFHPEGRDFTVIPMLNHFHTYIFHPQLGPLRQTKLNDIYGLDVQDFIMLSPIEIY